MKEKCCLLFGIVLLLIVVSESRVIVPRALPGGGSFDEQLPFTINGFKKDNEIGLKSAIRGLPTESDDFDTDYGAGGNGPRVGSSDYDRNIPDKSVNERDNNLPGTNPERFPLNTENDEKQKENPIEDKPIHKDDDESVLGDSDSEEYEDNSDKDYKLKNKEKPDEERKDEVDEHKPDDEEKPDEERKDEENEDKSEDEEKLDEERKDEEEDHKPEDEEKPDEESRDEEEDHKQEDEEKADEEEKYEPEELEEKKYIPKEEPIDDEKKDEVPEEVEEGAFEGEEAGSFNEDSIFDNPFFNLDQVKKYYKQLERALSHIFRQKLDEALLLNGTYTNTTEEEVDIDGKKYIITKSIIKGSDNHSSLYVESLSSKPKMNDTQVIKDAEMKNETHA